MIFCKDSMDVLVPTHMITITTEFKTTQTGTTITMESQKGQSITLLQKHWAQILATFQCTGMSNQQLFTLSQDNQLETLTVQINYHLIMTTTESLTKIPMVQGPADTMKMTITMAEQINSVGHATSTTMAVKITLMMMMIMMELLIGQMQIHTMGMKLVKWTSVVICTIHTYHGLSINTDNIQPELTSLIQKLPKQMPMMISTLQVAKTVMVQQAHPPSQQLSMATQMETAFQTLSTQIMTTTTLQIVQTLMMITMDCLTCTILMTTMTESQMSAGTST